MERHENREFLMPNCTKKHKVDKELERIFAILYMGKIDTLISLYMILFVTSIDAQTDLVAYVVISTHWSQEIWIHFDKNFPSEN